MPAIKTPPNKKVIDLNAPAEELTDDEEERLFQEEEAKLRAEELKREIEEQNKFDCLCDGGKIFYCNVKLTQTIVISFPRAKISKLCFLINTICIAP